MKFIDAINAKIVRIKEKAVVDKAAIDAVAAAEILDLEATLASGENWLQKQSVAFYTKVSRVMDQISD
jgi:hypothetical protein